MSSYKRHPKRQHVSVRDDGKLVKHYGDVVVPKEHEPKPGHKIMVVMLKGTYYSLAKLVAETYLEPPPPKKRHYAICKDRDFKNTHPDNLEWSTSNVSKDAEKRFENAVKNSRLTEQQAVECYFARKDEQKTLRDLAEKYGVSDMSIHRAIKRVKKTFKKDD